MSAHLMHMKKQIGPVLIILALLGGCAAPGSTQSGGQSAAVEAPAPPPPKLTPAQEAEKAEARQAYVTCLRQAAHYASQKATLAGDAPALIAPMCYPQFSRFESADAAGMEGRARRAFDQKGDQRQMDFAADAIRQERGLAALSATQ
ncbi:MAG: hypothetical protein JWM91_1448 [Rhodospirillales bacterium]|nr:hypothetical protein [Rhodospirillales bacterium]